MYSFAFQSNLINAEDPLSFTTPRIFFGRRPMEDPFLQVYKGESIRLSQPTFHCVGVSHRCDESAEQSVEFEGSKFVEGICPPSN
mmetsp:Transcript_19827/g.55257  ORF Transcript_19827/g.55257 Transcript_19827/m.55257 type:complete len:85 (+) Transcript_19827:284-538(+)